jgi:hypothetical protein
MSIEIGGVFGLIVLIANIWALIHIAQSTVTPGKKALWIVLILLLPVFGLIIWLIGGPRAAQT